MPVCNCIVCSTYGHTNVLAIDGLSRLTIMSYNAKGEVSGKWYCTYIPICEYSKLIKACNDSQLDIRVLCKHINSYPSCNFQMIFTYVRTKVECM